MSPWSPVGESIGEVLTTVVIGVLAGPVFAVILAATRQRLPGGGEFAGR